MSREHSSLLFHYWKKLRLVINSLAYYKVTLGQQKLYTWSILAFISFTSGGGSLRFELFFHVISLIEFYPNIGNTFFPTNTLVL